MNGGLTRAGPGSGRRPLSMGARAGKSRGPRRRGRRCRTAGIPGAVAVLLGLTVGLPPRGVVGQSTTQGILHVVWDGEGLADPDRREFYLVRRDGSSIRLEVGTSAGLDADALTLLDRRSVSLDTGPALAPGAPNRPELRVVGVRALDAGPAPFRASVAAQDFVTLLCRYGDDPSSPFGVDEVARVHGPTYPGVAQFYQEHSRDPLTMSGNTVAGWYDLPSPRSRYVEGSYADLGALARDCTAAADPDVDFAQFHGINLQFNGPLRVRSTGSTEVVSLGGSWALELDGEFRVFGLTWLSGEHWNNYVVQTHEVGHALGWPHSSGRYGEEYDSRWDVMSRGYLRWEPPWGWLSIHTIANHKRMAGWIPEERIWRPAVGEVETAVLSRSALPPSDGYLMARIPRDDGVVYTVEARLEAGHDTPLPAEAVLIHEVEGVRAYVVDPDGDGDPNDESAQWIPGETFEDTFHGIRVSVDERLPDGFLVTISNQVQPTCPLTLASEPDEGGAARFQAGEAEGPCGRTVAVVAEPAEGWRFAEWTLGGASVSTENPFTLEVETEGTLVAHFVEQCRVGLSAVPPEGGAVSVLEGGELGDCGRQVSVQATAQEGWRFDGWIEDGEPLSPENPLSLDVAGDRDLQALFVEQCVVTLAADPEAGGVASFEEGEAGGDCGRSVTVVAEASEGWGFRRWREADEVLSDEGRYDFVVESDRALTAEFQQQCVVRVSAEPPEGGIAEVTDGGEEGVCGRTVVARAAAALGWGFVSWSEEGAEVATDPLLELTPDRDRELVAGFVRLCRLDLVTLPDEGGAATVAEGSASGACGRVVTVTAEADPGWLFVGWVDAGEAMGDEPTITFPVDEDRALQAVFVQAQDLAARLLTHVLEGGEAPNPAERGALDRLGNQNGDLDLGDLLALLDAFPDALGASR